ncbi:hypothetical protein TWF225_006976 [Orbilia oligospora]|uniref:Uncharacterized protein n=1 Tax=Orbilia oligospora TaxID=2813651 RepID=A0A7C8PWC1_ORBOL|nr:hypothetical protein TWF751_008288 [Orbilia oligospora]KAF3194434.1 hypothetical protein TWF225_006976 [Orbilia oligospora]KAF3296063.1 hypothetical protein TWF132_011532 [Orbilia oligospora]TGJ68605.1 hypothetical protein EYR41_007647 [Orbilia oligospora]
MHQRVQSTASIERFSSSPSVDTCLVFQPATYAASNPVLRPSMCLLLHVRMESHPAVCTCAPSRQSATRSIAM